MLKQIWDKHKEIFYKEGLWYLVIVLLRSAKRRLLTPVENLFFYLIYKTKTNEKTIIFQSHGDFWDNARALYEYMLKNGYGQKYKLIWFVSDPNKLTQYKNSDVKFITFPYHNKKEEMIFTYYKNKAKYFFFTHPGGWIVPWKNDQTVINLSHGCGFKKAKGNLKIGEFFDIGFTIGKFHIDIESVCFGCNKNKLLHFGYSRNDILIRQKYSNFSKKIKTIVWMPTFRKSYIESISEDYLENETGLPLIETNRQLSDFDTFLKLKGVRILLKIHHLQSEIPILRSDFQNIDIITDDVLLKNGQQLYELVAQTDALITDYSSIAFDYLLLDKPIAFILSDYDEYAKSRSFSIANPKDYMPGPHIYKFEELLSFIESISRNEDNFYTEREKIKNLAHTYTDGKSSERILNYLNIKL